MPLSYFAGEDGFVSILTCENGYRGPREIVFAGQTVPFEACGFGMMAHEDGVSVTAHHVAEGVLMVFDPLAPVAISERPIVSTCAIAPAILDAFGISPPPAMRAVNRAIFPGVGRRVEEIDRGSAVSIAEAEADLALPADVFQRPLVMIQNPM